MSKQIMIDETICDFYSDTREDEEGAHPIVGWCNDNECKCSEIPFDECRIKTIEYCKLKDKQLARKTQECEKIKNWVKSKMFYTDCVNWFERFVYAFDDWQTDLQKQLDQLKASNEQAEQKLERIRDFMLYEFSGKNEWVKKQILQIIDEVE